ncbi:flippase [Salipiger mucosus]|uniref:Polysaccharide biosynthesis protein n=1 Tax=Salipiger mucosus DSM 16094 TaxID=1123237 RepID=S9SFB6_9RHOB|nr:flippase [Salipiger mucosus]EPX84974.1 Polysaccharide biosynthesis protein [Salipiger mucosus DSM 16094]
MKLRMPTVSDVRARLLKSAGWLLARQVVNMFNSLVLGVVLARHLGPDGFGVLNYAVSLVVMMLPITTLGLRNLSLREYASRPDDAPRILGTIAAMRFMGTLVAIGAMLFIAIRFPAEHDNIALLCLFLGIALLFQVFDTIKEQFIASQKPRIFVMVEVCVLACFSLLKVGLVLADMPVDAFIIANGFETIGQGCASGLAYYLKAGTPPRMQVDRVLMRRYARNALPLLLGSISTVIYLKIDIVFLSNMVGKEATGLYAVAARMSEAWYILPSTLAMAAFPRMVELRGEDPVHYRRRMQEAMDLFAAFGTCVAATSIFWAAPVIWLLFGDAYAGAVSLLQIQVWVGVVFATRQLIDKQLLADGLFWGSAIINLTGAVANVACNLVLIPIYGAEGAAYATLISYTLAPLLLAPVVPAIRPVAKMQLRAIFWPRRAVQFASRQYLAWSRS